MAITARRTARKATSKTRTSLTHSKGQRRIKHKKGFEASDLDEIQESPGCIIQLAHGFIYIYTGMYMCVCVRGHVYMHVCICT